MRSFNMQKFNPTTGQHFAVDPVCEMKVDPQNPLIKILYKGKTYCFCSELCKRMFEREPGKYVKTDES